MSATGRDPHGQLAFDLDALIHEADVAAAPAWTGAPLHFTTVYHPPAELIAALERSAFEHRHSGRFGGHNMWHPAITLDHANDPPGHDLTLLSADLRCDHHEESCACVGDLIYQAICEGCAWHHIGDEPAVVEAWHDHAWPGWRDLPVVPLGLARWDDQTQPVKKLIVWLTEHQPADWQTPGAPILTERGLGTRHVPRRSPWGGFDLSHTALRPNDPEDTRS